VFGGHLCEAEAPTEPTGETNVPHFALNTMLIYMPVFSAEP